MIEKFIHIKNIGRFRNCSPRGDVSFKKLTLLYAENGRGKTTLSSILRSLQTGQREYIAERQTLGGADPASVQIRLGGNTFSFGTHGWSNVHPDIAIFDSVFVHNNVFAGDYVEHEHKKNLYRVIVGAGGVQLAKQIEELDGRIREANVNIRSKKDIASKLLPNGTTIETYLNWQSISDIDTKIGQKNAEIAHRQKTLEKASEIQSKGLLAKVCLPSFPTDFFTILSKQLENVLTDSEGSVRQQIHAHNMGRQGETWLSQGLGFIAENKCPFCGQEIGTNELIAAYRSHFNIAYAQLKQEVAQLPQKISQAIGEHSLVASQQTISGNLILVEFWKQFFEIELPSFDLEDVRNKYTTIRECALTLAQRKQQSPIETIVPDDDFQTSLQVLTSLQALVEAYNVAVDKVNALINEQKVAVERGTNINDLKRELIALEANKKRFEPGGVQACDEYQAAVDEKLNLEQQKTAAKERLDQHCQQIIQAYQTSINAYLDQFNAGFRIKNTRYLYTGGTPSSHYQIEINNSAVDLGDSQTRPGTPCFKTTLSSGDRSALAFAFFLAALQQDATIGNKIVVLDDPFTSQDRFRRTCTQQLICQLATKARQVIVLSHDLHFLKLIYEGYSATDINILQMCPVGGNTDIKECDIDAETQSTYMKNYSTLLGFYRERNGIAMDVARSIRPFIEGLLRSHFPGHFQPSEWLGNFIEKIRNSTDGDGLSHAQADLSELEAINDYSKKYHHDQNPSADIEPLSEDELHGFVKRTLRFVGGC